MDQIGNRHVLLKDRLDGLIADTGAVFYIDATPLLDANWTGIPMVAAKFAQRFLDFLPDQTEFFFEHLLLDKELVRAALAANSGQELNARFRGEGSRRLALEGGGLSVGFFPSIKRVRGYFDVETSISHDLSTLITPEFHTAANVDHHMRAMVPDILTNDLTLCVSDATRLDLLAYLGEGLGPLATVYNGVEWPEEFAVRYSGEVGQRPVERYVMILGTREPRKNIAKIFEMLMLHPEVLEEMRFVFVGKTGWLQDKTKVPQVLADAEARGRIVFTGFVSEYDKYKLLRAAWLTLYPSFFEGFGLPVVESLSVGTPCLASFSSSLPEVGGPQLPYFDPLSASDLYAKLSALTKLTPAEWDEIVASGRKMAERFTWDDAFATMIGHLAPIMTRAAQDLGLSGDRPESDLAASRLPMPGDAAWT
jgi:glycosyltransferase involved in cell wall biosynthesis